MHKMLKLLENAKVDFHFQISFKIHLILLLYSFDPESIDQGDIFKMKKQFLQQIPNFDNPEEHYKIYYFGISFLGSLVEILQIMGMSFDPKIIVRLEGYLREEKHTYIKFFSSLESFLDS